MKHGRYCRVLLPDEAEAEAKALGRYAHVSSFRDDACASLHRKMDGQMQFLVSGVFVPDLSESPVPVPVPNMAV